VVGDWLAPGHGVVECVVNVVGFVVVFLAEWRQPQGHVFKDRLGVPFLASNLEMYKYPYGQE
jgi:hypothetical protein